MNLRSQLLHATSAAILFFCTMSAAQAQDKPTFKPGGYMQAVVQMAQPNGIPSVGSTHHEQGKYFLRAGLRRSYWGVESTYKGWKAKGEIIILDHKLDFYKAYIGYTLPQNKSWSFDAGLNTVPFGMELTTSSRERETIERALYFKDLFPSDVDFGLAAHYKLPHHKPYYVNHLTVDAALIGGNDKHGMRKSIPDAVLRLEAGHKDEQMVRKYGVSGFYGYVTDSKGNHYTRAYAGCHLSYALLRQSYCAKLYLEGIMGRQPGLATQNYAIGKNAPEQNPEGGAIKERDFMGGMAMIAVRGTSVPLEGVVKYSYYARNCNLKRELEKGFAPEPSQFLAEGVSHNTTFALNGYFNDNRVRVSLYYELIFRQTAANAAYKPIMQDRDDLLSLALQFAF